MNNDFKKKKKKEKEKKRYFFSLLTFNQTGHAQLHGRLVTRHVHGNSSRNVYSQSVARILGSMVGTRQRLVHNRDAQTPKNRVHFVHRAALSLSLSLENVNS